MKKYIYILFSATPYKTGSFIRHMIRNQYNHVAISLDENLSHMYSFSRFHANAPFFAGFTKESFSRYEWHGNFSDIKVCKIEVPERIYEMIEIHLQRMIRQSKAYVYNYYSAAMTPLNHRVRIRNAYTCVEFVGDILGMTGIGVKLGDFHSIPKLEEVCAPYLLYEGSARSYPAASSWKGDAFREKMPISVGVAATAESFGRLTVRGLEDAYGFCCEKFGTYRKRHAR